MANYDEIDLSLLDELTSSMNDIDVEGVTAESGENSNQKLPDGYYLAEVVAAGLETSKNSGKLQVKFQYKVIEGFSPNVDANGNASYEVIDGVANRNFWKYYTNITKKDNPDKYKDKLEKLYADCLKFEGEVPGEPLLSKEYFTNPQTLNAALECLVGSRIYTFHSTSKKANDNGEYSQFVNLVTWERAVRLELPTEE